MALKKNVKLVTTSPSTLYTCPSGTDAAVQSIVVGNPTGAQGSFTVTYYDYSTSTSITIIPTTYVKDGATYSYPRSINLKTGDYISISGTNNLTVQISVYELTTTLNGFTNQGTWSNSTAYAVNDIVNYNGSSYSAIQAGTNQNPATATTYWALFAQSGYSGYSGATGSSGISGYSGATGSQGTSGFSGYSGAVGSSGISGYSGYSGYSGSGISGYSGYSGSNGSGLGYVVQLNGGKLSPADSQTYYFGSMGDVFAPSTTAALYRLYVPKAGTIKAVASYVYVSGTLGSTENVGHSIVVNNTTTVSLGNQVYNAAQTFTNFTGLSQAVSAGDYLQIKIVCPAWVTNPTNVYWVSLVSIE